MVLQDSLSHLQLPYHGLNLILVVGNIGWSVRNGKVRDVFSQGLYVFSQLSDKTFKRCSWSEISCPVSIHYIRIWEEVIFFGWVSVALLLNDVDVLAWGWVFDGHSILGTFSVDVIDELIHVFEPNVPVNEMEILTQCVHQVRGSVMQSHWLKVVD